MNISEPFIKRPVGTSLLTLGLLLAGSLAFTLLPVAPLPQVEYPVIYVTATLPGASPETMGSSVATPLERQFGRIAGVTEMTSTSQLGSTNITLQFDLNRNIDAAARDVQAAINAARGTLPSNLPQNPTYRKVNPADAPIMILAMTSDSITKPDMYDAADSILAQKLWQVEGIGQVFVGGAAQPAVRAELNPTQLNNTGVGLDLVRTALGSANANQAKGQLSSAQEAVTISANDQIWKAYQYRDLIVAYRNGSPVRLSDVATVQDNVADIHTAGFANGKPAVLMIVFRQPGANIIGTVDRVYALLPQLRASVSPAIDISVLMDRTTTIRASVRDIEFTLIISIVLVIFVVFVFLRNLWTTLIPSVSVPLSLIGTFGAMYLLHYSLDNLSLMALAISTGFVVDDAIVVIENITRYLEQGYSPVQAAYKGSREIGFTVLSMSTSLVAVFIPILLMGGIVGRLFREFAVTLSIAIAVSLVVSLTTTPMMCAKFLKPVEKQKHGRLYRSSERVFDWILESYSRGLGWVLRHQPFTLAVTIGTVCLSVALYIFVPKGFFPQQDTGRLMGSIQAAQDISFGALRQKLSEYAAIVQKDPAVDQVMVFSGGRGLQNSGSMFITLKPLAARKNTTADQVIGRLRRQLAVIPGATLYIQAAQDLQIGGRQSASQFQYSLQSENLQELNNWAPQLLAQLRALPQLRDVSTDQQDKGLEAHIQIDRDTAARIGVTSAAIDSALYDAFGQRQVSTIYRPLNQYHVVMEVDPSYSQNPQALDNIYVRGTNNAVVPLGSFAQFVQSSTALGVNHQGQFPSVTLAFNLAPGVSLGQATVAILNVQRQIGMPSDIHAQFAGTAAAFQRSLSSQPLLIMAALATVYIVLGMLYESYIHPITILSTLPSAGVGALLALVITRTDLSVIAVIGIILLIGIVKKNAIMMIDFALEAEREEHKPPEEAIFQACLLRFRPIMMTTMAALLGGLPLALGSGTGAELRRPLGITIVGGLLLSQLLTLYTTPVVYLWFDRLAHRFEKYKIGNPIPQELSADSAD